MDLVMKIYQGDITPWLWFSGEKYKTPKKNPYLEGKKSYQLCFMNSFKNSLWSLKEKWI